jgi:purine-binding chemotaxis protein CheW
MSHDRDQQGDRTGRRALFAGTPISVPKEECIPISEVTDSVQQISTYEADGERPVVSPHFEPVIARLTEYAKNLQSCRDECTQLQGQLRLKDENTRELESENSVLNSEREMYLNDLITSHTEFDRALEIFQYHEVPMVLTGAERSIHDANDTFCTLYSIARSEITQNHPDLASYLPDNESVIAPDGQKYAVITLTPPIVPFDHDAVSLIALIQIQHQILTDGLLDNIGTSKDSDNNIADDNSEFLTGNEVDYTCLTSSTPDIRIEAFNQFPIPTALINHYKTVIACNSSFCRLLGRTQGLINLRDIGSCGIFFEDNQCVNEVLSDGLMRQCQAIVTHPDGEEIPVYIEILPIGDDPETRNILIVGVAVNDNQEADFTDKQSDDLILRMLLDLNPSAAALLDTHARVILSNEGFSEITGISSGDLTGTDVRDLGITIPDTVLCIGATDVIFLPDTIRISSAWGISELSGMVIPVGSSGTDISAILILQPIESQSNQSISLLEKQTEKNQSFEKVAINKIPVPCVETDFSGAIVQVNHAFINLCGYSADTLAGKPRDEILKYEKPGIVKVSGPAGEFSMREVSGNADMETGIQTFWYYDISSELNLIADLSERITALDTEMCSMREQEAALLGTRSPHADTVAGQIDIVEFELNEERYAMDITMVREVVEMLPITPLPRTSPYVTGIINLRGEVTHIIDLAILLGQRPKKDRSGQKIIIVPSDITNGEHVGIIVDTVQSVTEIHGRHVSLLGEDVSLQIQTHIKGIIKISHDDVLEKHAEVSTSATLVIWLDIQKILQDIQGSS